MLGLFTTNIEQKKGEKKKNLKHHEEYLFDSYSKIRVWDWRFRMKFIAIILLFLYIQVSITFLAEMGVDQLVHAGRKN